MQPPTPNQQTPAPEQDVTDQAFTQDVRRVLIKQIVGEQIAVPNDKTQAALLNNLLNGMDKQITDRGRLKALDTANKNSGDSNNLVANFLREIATGNVKPVETPPSTDNTPVWPTNLPAFTPVPGQTHQGVITNDFDSFTREFEQQNPLPKKD